MQLRLVELCLEVNWFIARAFKPSIVLNLEQANFSVSQKFGGLEICGTRLARAQPTPQMPTQFSEFCIEVKQAVEFFCQRKVFAIEAFKDEDWCARHDSRSAATGNADVCKRVGGCVVPRGGMGGLRVGSKANPRTKPTTVRGHAQRRAGRRLAAKATCTPDSAE